MNAISEKYLTEKLEREFKELCQELDLGESVTREEVFELLVKLGYLKSVDQLKSIFVAEENIQQFDNIIKRLELTSFESRIELM